MQNEITSRIEDGVVKVDLNVFKSKARCVRYLEQVGHGYIANLIVSWHSNPFKKLQGVVELVNIGCNVRIGNHIDVLIIDDEVTQWASLESNLYIDGKVVAAMYRRENATS